MFACDMMGMGKVGEDVRSLWFEVTAPHVKERVPQGVQELQTAVQKAGAAVCARAVGCVACA